MNDIRDDPCVDEERSIHIRSTLGRKSWEKVAPQHLPEATELDKRRYIEAITLYWIEHEREQSTSTRGEREKSKSLELLSGQLITKIEALLDDPHERRFASRLSRLMRGTVTEADLQKALQEGIAIVGANGEKIKIGLKAAEKRTWESPGDKRPNPLGALKDLLELFRRSTSALARPPTIRQSKPTKRARAKLLVCLYRVWKSGSGFGDTPEAWSQFINFLVTVSDTLSPELTLGTEEAIKKAARAACKN